MANKSHFNLMVRNTFIFFRWCTRWITIYNCMWIDENVFTCFILLYTVFYLERSPFNIIEIECVFVSEPDDFLVSTPFFSCTVLIQHGWLDSIQCNVTIDVIELTSLISRRLIKYETECRAWMVVEFFVSHYGNVYSILFLCSSLQKMCDWLLTLNQLQYLRHFRWSKVISSSEIQSTLVWNFSKLWLTEKLVSAIQSHAIELS